MIVKRARYRIKIPDTGVYDCFATCEALSKKGLPGPHELPGRILETDFPSRHV